MSPSHYDSETTQLPSTTIAVLQIALGDISPSKRITLVLANKQEKEIDGKIIGSINTQPSSFAFFLLCY